MVRDNLKQQYNGFKIYSEQQVIDPEKSWQDHIYDVSITCCQKI